MKILGLLLVVIAVGTPFVGLAIAMGWRDFLLSMGCVVIFFAMLFGGMYLMGR